MSTQKRSRLLETISGQKLGRHSSDSEQVSTAKYELIWTYGEIRKAAAAYLQKNHYLRSSGGSGAMIAVRDTSTAEICGACLINPTTSKNCDHSLICGAALIGPTGSADVERSLAEKGVLIRQIKRSHLRDDVQMYESHLLRKAMQAVTDAYDQPTLYVSYADPAATDERTGLPLLGWCYLAAGFFCAGETTGKRWCVIDHCNRARSTRQGSVTLNRRTLPQTGDTFHGEHITRTWQMRPLPPARIWLAVVTPSHYTRKQAKHAFLNIWKSINPNRQIAAKLWISHTDWRRALATGVVPIGEPKPQHVREHDRFQPAFWQGNDIRRTAAPTWVPYAWQQRLILETDINGETVAQRRYEPLCDGLAT